MTFTEDEIVDTVNNIFDKLSDKVFIAGGCARYLLAKEYLPENDVPSDIDLFLFKQQDFGYVRKGRKEMQYDQNCNSCYAATYGKATHTDDNMFVSHIPIQVIKPFENKYRVTYGDPLKVISGFTLDMERWAIWRNDKGELMQVYGYTQEKWDKLKTTYLHYNKEHIDNPISAALRMSKYGMKGYTIERKSVADLFKVWDSMTPEERNECMKAYLYEKTY